MAKSIRILYGLPDPNPYIGNHPDSGGKNHPSKLFDLLADQARGGPETLLYIVPTRSMAGKFEREMLDRGIDCLASDCYTTLNDLAIRIFASLRPSVPIVDDTLRTLIIEKLAADSPPGEDIPFNTDSQGFVRAIADDIKILKQSLVSLKKARGASAEGGGSRKSRILVHFAEIYDRHLESAGLVDAEDVMRLIAATPVEDLKAGALGSTERLIMHGFFDFSPTQIIFVKKLCECANDALILLDYQPDRDRIFRPAELSVAALREIGATIDPRPIPHRLAESSTGHLAENIFTTPLARRERLADPGGVSILRADSRAGEVEATAAEIKRLVMGDDTPLRNICVTFPRADRYAELIREIFPRYGIQFNFSYGFPLNESPIIIAIFRMLEVARDFNRERVCELLYSPYIRWKSARCEELEPAEFIDRVSRDAQIIEGRDSWRDGLARLAETAVRSKSNAPAGDADPDAVDYVNRRLDAHANRIKRLITLLEEFFKSLDSLNRKRPLAEYCALLLTLTREFGLREGITRNEPSALPPIELEKNFRALARFERAMSALADYETLLPGEDRKKMSLDEFVSLLRSVIASERYQVGTHRDAGVQVMEFPETRGMEFDHLYVIGMINRDFPSTTRPSIFLTRGDIAALRMPGREKHEAEQRYHFLRLICCPEKRLTFSCPMSEEGEPTVMSPFLHEVASFFENEIIYSPDANADSIFSKYKLFERTVALHTESPEAATELSELLKDDFPQLNVILSGLRIEAMRKDGEAPSPWSGVIESPAAIEEIGKRLAPPHPFSITQLENYGRCPFRFMALHLMALEEMVEPEEEISPLTKGGIIHEILRRFFLDRRARGKSSVMESERDEARAELTKLAEEAFGRVPFRDLFLLKEKERVIGEGGLIDEFLNVEIKYSSADCRCVPRFFEFSFGGKPRDDETDPESNKPYLKLAEDIDITGRIDRVDKSEDGAAIVIDYKTGRSGLFPGINEIRKGTSYQLPIYMLAVERLLGLKAAAGEYYQAHDGSHCGRVLKLGDRHLLDDNCYLKSNSTQGHLPSAKCDMTLEQLIEDTAERAREAIGRMRRGEFHVTAISPSDAGCKHCAFRFICRHPDAPKDTY